MTVEFVMKDFTEKGVIIRKEECFTVQHFSYLCERKRNDHGVPFGPTQPSYLSVTIRVEKEDTASGLINQMWIKEPYPYTLLFNPTYETKKGTDTLSTYEDALMVRAYPVDIEEFKHVGAVQSAKNGNPVTEQQVEQEDQMLIQVKLLLCKVVYAADSTSGTNLKMNISQD